MKKKIVGIYWIVCIANGKIYIGSSSNVIRRFEAHKSVLNRRKHANPHLQAAWDKYGPSAFLFEILSETELPNLIRLEQRYLDLHDSTNREKGFNIRIKAESNVGLVVSEETRAKISRTTTGRPPRSPEVYAKIGAAHKGKTISPEARAKMSAAKLGNKHSPEQREKMSVSTRQRGPEWRAKLSAAKMGNKNSLGRIQPPDVLAKISAASKAMWEKRRAATLTQAAQ